jgi:amino acid adenylation domain-containing protein
MTENENNAELNRRLANLSPSKRALLERKLQKNVVAQAPVIQPCDDGGPAPLSFGQQRLWFLEQLLPDHSAAHIPVAVYLTGTLNVEALQRSIGEILRRHEVLRAAFPSEDGTPVQIAALASGYRLPVTDLSALTEHDRQGEEVRITAGEAHGLFDMARGGLVRTRLLKLSDTRHLLLLTMHHIVSDGWSLSIFNRELSVLYNAFVEGKPSPLGELPIQYADFARWQREWLRGDVLQSQLAYWKQLLGGRLPVLDLPTDRPRPAIQTFRGHRQTLRLSPSLVESLNALSRSEDATLSMTLLAAFKTLLHRLTAQDDIVVGMPIAGRNRLETENLIGFFVNTLVLRTDLAARPTFRELLRRVRKGAVEAYNHQDLPFEKLVEELHPNRSLSHTPLFQVFFNMLNLPEDRLKLNGLTAEHANHAEAESKFDLTLYVREDDEGITLDFTYNADLFSQARAAEMLGQLGLLLTDIAGNPDKPVRNYSLLTSAAKAVLPDPTRQLDRAGDKPVHRRFAEQARRLPRHEAIIDSESVWTYEELDRASSRIADHLRQGGIREHDVVAIHGTRSATFVCALLGILKAGAAFLILNPAYPVRRLTEYLRAANPKGLFHLGAAGNLPVGLQRAIDESSCCFRLDVPQRNSASVREMLPSQSQETPPRIEAPDAIAYVAFTSGSTGTPKGIVGTHRPLAHFFEWYAREFPLSDADRFAMLSGLSHDPLLRDIFGPLCLGATLCIPREEDLANPERLCQWMANHDISVIHLPPAMARLLSEEARDSRLPRLRHVFFGADVLTRADVRNFQRLAPSATFVNFYGATETPQAIACHIVRETDDASKADGSRDHDPKIRVPIGKGIEGVQLLLLNTQNQMTGIGEIGEIHIRTPYLANGYLNDEALTAQRFIINPFTQWPEDRIYKSGDLARYSPNGEVDFIGRRDLQVNLRGHRVELEEIETVLAEHLLIQTAVVVATEHPRGETALAAYITVHGNEKPSVASLRQFARETLPDFMVPCAFIFCDSLPLTQNGKIDRNALPALEPGQIGLSGEYVAPRNETERRIGSIWEKILGVERAGMDDDFFDLGGHSLLGIQLIAKLRKTFQVDIPLRTLFGSPTVAGLAVRIDELLRGGLATTPAPAGNWQFLVPIQVGTRPPLFLVPGGGGGEEEFLVYARLARFMGREYTMYGLRARGLDGVKLPHRSVKEMSADYVREIREFQPVGPYSIIGECIGGIVAFEMARQLAAQGQRVSSLILMDTQFPNTTIRLRAWRRDIARRTRESWPAGFSDRIVHYRRIMPEMNWGERLGYFADKAGKIIQRLLYVSHLKRLPISDPAHEQRMNVKRARAVYPQSMLRYRPKPYSGRLTIVVNREEFGRDGTPDCSRFAQGGIDTHMVPGNHHSYIREHAESAAAQLRACLQKGSNNE